MFTVHYEEYWNDFMRKEHEKRFSSLDDIESWMFGMMRRDYKNDSLAMYFPKGDKPSEIHLHPERGGPNYWIHLITSADGIVFSDGRQTAGQKFASKRVQEWLAHCMERRDKPAFNFVE